jgi:hypothetical protein
MNNIKFLYLVAFFIAISCFSLLAQSNYQPISDQGMTSGTHNKNVGKIVWAKQRVTFAAQDNMSFSNSFTEGDAIYGRGYLKKCLYNLSIDEGDDNCLNPENQYELRLIIDGKEEKLLADYYFPNQDWTTFQISLILSPGDSEDGINQGMTNKWAGIANSLSKGKHDMKIELWGGKKGCTLKKYVEGSFAYTKTSDSKLKGSGPEVPNAEMKNEKLEKEMIQAIQKQGWKNDTPIDIVILEPDWRIIRDGFGNIIAREINTFAIIKKSDGNCHATDISFRQQYKGKNYGITEFYGLGMKNIPVECSEYGK